AQASTYRWSPWRSFLPIQVYRLGSSGLPCATVTPLGRDGGWLYGGRTKGGGSGFERPTAGGERGTWNSCLGARYPAICKRLRYRLRARDCAPLIWRGFRNSIAVRLSYGN